MAFNASNAVPVAHPLFFILTVVQLVLAVILLGLLADLASFLGSNASVASGAAGVGLFTTILTLGLGVYYLVATTAATKIYNAYAVLALEAAAVLFWLISFALLADTVSLASFNGGSTPFEGVCEDDAYYCWDKRSVKLQKRSGSGNPSDVLDAALAFAVIEWLLFIATLVLYVLSLHKERSGTATHHTSEAKLEAQTAAPQQDVKQDPVPLEEQHHAPTAATGHQEQPLH